MGQIKIYYFETLDSTNNKAKELNAPENEYVIYTKKQTKGRGQYDRIWISKTGLTFSIVTKKENANYSSIVPNAIIDYLYEKGIEATIKYPNDIYYQNKKLGGILIENIYHDNLYNKTIIGIGLNINEDIDIEKKIDNSICIKLEETGVEIIEEISSRILQKNN
ncbi:MAG: biotin--[Clostridia bacterium]|nr:biotin--[acetyl-CoA-carboxylase] ligase [Clostridia bacterium]